MNDYSVPRHTEPGSAISRLDEVLFLGLCVCVCVCVFICLFLVLDCCGDVNHF